MAAKEYPLSIIIKAIDQATAPLRHVSENLHKITEPLKEISEVGHKVGEALEFLKVVEGIKLVGEAAEWVVEKLHGILEGYATLGHAAERIGIGVDSLVGLQFAAKLAGVPIEALNEGLTTFNRNLGQLEAGKGRLKSFLDTVSPNFERRLKGTKGVENRIFVLADGMKALNGQIEKQTALARAAGFGPEMVAFLAQGGDAVRAYVEESKRLSGPQKEATEAGKKFEEAMVRVDAAMMRVKAAIATSLGPVLTKLAEQFTDFLGEHSEDITKFFEGIGEKLPGVVEDVVGVFKKIIAAIPDVISAIGDIWSAIKTVGDVVGPVGKFIVDVFRDTGELIAAIAQGIVDAVEAVKKAAGWVGDRFTGGDATLGGEGAAAAEEFKRGLGRNHNLVGDWRPGAATTSKAEVTVSFEQAPRGMRATTDPGSTADVSVDVGYQMSYMP